MRATYSDLKGKSVFITGGGAGIGAAVTEAFLEQGAKVAFIQRREGSGFCDEMERRYGNRPMFLSCDVTDIRALKSAIDQAADANGDIDVLVSNAANDQRHSTEEVDEEFWQWCNETNLRPYFFAAQAVLPGMRKAGGGSIINFSSISYMMGNAGYPLYASANAAITGLTRSLAREFGSDNIRVNAVAPGWVMTERQKEKWVTSEGLEQHLARQCIPRELQPEDIAPTIVFLASESSRMLTGQLIAVDGGVVTTG